MMTEFIAQTTAGKLKGFEKFDCAQFRGIPFASVERWRSPRPVDAWDGVRDALEFGPICPQVVGTMERLAGQRRPMHPMDEDCLSLNVYTPAVDDALRPVMVWIHGGAFATGTGRIPWYSGHNFCRDGVVVVTINYRLNAFGFVRLDDLFDGFENTGTLGIQDQIAALEWVRDNIASFGGDPSNVTIFGESAGGMSVGTLLASPRAKGLFAKAIPQSGAAHNSHRPENAERVARKFLELVGVRPGDAEALGALTAEQILDGVARSGAESVGLPFQPCIGDDVVPVAPIDGLRTGAAKDISTIVGTNLDEANLFALNEEGLERGPSLPDLGPYERKLGDERAVRLAVQTDAVFRIPAIRLAEAQASNDAPVWMYRFDWRSPAMNGRMGAAHALEIPFVFDNLDAPGADFYTGGAGPQSIATDMHAAWVSFAKTGDPAWDRYDATSRATKIFDEPSRVESDPDGETRELWSGVL